MPDDERRCACGNLGKLDFRTGKRRPKCGRCYESPAAREVQLQLKRNHSRHAYASGRWAERRADQLARGQRLMDQPSHHKGMAALKARLGDPRPPGMTLSLIRPDSPNAYDGWDQRVTYRLSTDPADYVWETQAENNARKLVP